MDAATRVYLVRHGQSTFNAQERYQGRNDEPELTEKGRQQAFATGRHLAGIRFDAVISSPLRRARQTAEVVAAGLTGTVTISEDLSELDLGAWQGLSVGMVRERFAADYRTWRERPQEFRMTDALGREFFPVQELFAQAERFWREFLARHSGKQVLLVSHGGTVRALAATAVGIPMERFQHLHMGNCGISILERRRDGLRIEGWNLTDHVGDHPVHRGLEAMLLPAGHTRAALRADFVYTADDASPAAFDAAAQGRMRPGVLTTGVFIAPAPLLEAWLSQALGRAGASPWKPLAAAVLHYQLSGPSPVVRSFQADKISGSCPDSP